MARPTFHACQTAIKPKFKKEVSDKAETLTQASTAATSVIGNDKKNNRGGNWNNEVKGAVIAKISALSDE